MKKPRWFISYWHYEWNTPSNCIVSGLIEDIIYNFGETRGTVIFFYRLP